MTVFAINDESDLDRASDGQSRYGAYLRQNRRWFASFDDEDAVTTDPVAFMCGAWKVATSPVMSPPYVGWRAGPLRSVKCSNNAHDGALVVHAEFATQRPQELWALRGYGEWERYGAWGSDERGFYPPEGETLARGPVMLPSVLFMLPVPPGDLYAPQDAPGTLTVRDAKAAVVRLVEVLDGPLRAVLVALDR